MREISTQIITDTVHTLCIQANCQLPADIAKRIQTMQAQESWADARETLALLQENARIARQEQVPICQDTGMA